MLYGVPPVCVYLSINLNCSDKSMKLNYFYGTISICPRNGYNESLEFNATEQSGKLEFRYPYGNISPEQADAVSQFVKTVTDAYNVLQSQINRVNKRLKLEQYAPIVPPEVKTAGSDFDLDAEPAVSQPLHGGSDSTDFVEHSQQEQERLDMEELEAGESEEDTGL